MTVYVVISDSIINGHQSHGLHGVYATKSKAQSTAMTLIASEVAKHQGAMVKSSDIHVDSDSLEFSYQNDIADIFVSCIPQDVQ